MLLSIARFLLLGAVCFAAAQLWRAGVADDEPTEPIFISEGQIERLRSDWAAAWSSNPTDFEMRGLIERAIDDEVLHREALRLGLHRADPVVRQRLVQNMRFLGQREGAPSVDDDVAFYREALALGMAGSDLVVRRRLIQQMTSLIGAAVQEPTDAEVRALVAAHPDRFATSPKLRLSHVFFAPSDGAPLGPADSAELVSALSRFGEAGEGVSPDLPHAIRTGVFTDKSAGRVFGEDLAAQGADLPLGEWTGPFAHDGGQYWIRLKEVIPGGPAPFEFVRDRARHAMLQQRRADAIAQALRQLRLGYQIRVAGRVALEGRES